MKILIDLTSLADNFSGIEVYTMSVTKELIKNKDIDFILIFKNCVHKSFYNEYPNVEKVVLKGNNKLIFNQLILPWKLRNIKADRYLFMAFTEPFFWSKKDTINTIHDVSCWDCPGTNKKHMIWYWRLMFWKVARRKRKIITVSEFSKSRICDVLGVDPNNVYVTYCAPLETTKIDASDETTQFEIRKKYNLPDEYILCLSTLEPRKNLRFFLDAYAEMLANKCIEMDVVLAGRKGWMMDDIVKNMSSEMREKIHFTGFLDDDDLPYVYNMAKIFVFPSLYEGFGIPPLEAMSQGTVVLTNNVSSMPEILGESALYFENNSKKDLIDKITLILNMDGLQKRRLLVKADETLEKYKWCEISKKVLNVCMLT